MNGFIVGQDAIDVAKLSGVQLHRVPSNADEPADTDWKVAEALVDIGGVTVDSFYIDLDKLPTEDAGSIILSLIAIHKALHDFRSKP